MIIIWVVLSIMMYVVVGAIIAGLIVRYVTPDDDIYEKQRTAVTVTTCWPLVLAAIICFLPAKFVYDLILKGHR
jgi:uncharacterized membrane protein YraQ (UPF0718 family)